MCCYYYFSFHANLNVTPNKTFTGNLQHKWSISILYHLRDVWRKLYCKIKLWNKFILYYCIFFLEHLNHWEKVISYHRSLRNMSWNIWLYIRQENKEISSPIHSKYIKWWNIFKGKKKTVLRQQDPKILKACVSERVTIFLNPETVVISVRIFVFFLPLFLKRMFVLAWD